ncbi:hypothetical protein BKA69DRAFT_1080745 [Paraphysoderma sedebokerense]|nr:hypothetical protein BKA69DRAFT_1080745 [Paraphysoderma sedebokerense]
MLQSIQIFNMLLGIIYIMLVNYSLAIFDCTLQPDQNFYLDSQPNAKCYEDWHPEYVQFGIFAIVVYVLGIPLYFGTLLFCYYQSKFFTPNWNRAREIAAHVLDIPNSYFKESHQYFIVVQLLRKLLIVSIKLFLERLPVLQAVLTGFILSIDAILYTKYLPYTFTLLNVLEVTCTLFAMVIMNAGLLIHTDQLSPSQKDAASLIILSLIVISVGSCAAVAIYDTMIRAKKVVQETHQKRQQLQYIESLKIGGSLKREPSRARDHGGFQAASGNSAAKLLTGLGI